MFLTDSHVLYNKFDGACRNENGNYDDLGRFDVDSLDSCQQKCNQIPRCNAISWHYDGRCRLTSTMAETTSERNWKCYTRNGKD